MQIPVRRVNTLVRKHKRFKLVSPQAAQLCILYENHSCCTSTRDLIKNTLLIEYRREEKKAQLPAGIEPETSRSIYSEVLPLELTPRLSTFFKSEMREV